MTSHESSGCGCVHGDSLSKRDHDLRIGWYPLLEKEIKRLRRLLWWAVVSLVVLVVIALFL